MTYRNIIFDLDGTLTNPHMGILNSLQYALRQLYIEPVPVDLPSTFVGPPLQVSFKSIFGLNNKQTELAVEYFRNYYGRAGLYENEVYEGIPELFEALSEAGYKLFVATSKLEKFARLILDYFELDKYLEDMQGADAGGNHTKSELIQNIVDKYRLTPSETVMVGDTDFDIVGASECGIDAIAVGYGFGKIESLTLNNPKYYVSSVEELSDLFFGII